MFWAEQGAYTGEIAPGMLVGYCKYVILGHSERRQYFGETDEGVNKKAHAAFAHGLIPIVAVGENLEQNKSGETDTVVRTQLGGGLKGLTKEQVASLVIAYEPVWAIGTGLNAEPAGAQRVIGVTIRGMVASCTTRLPRRPFASSTAAAPMRPIAKLHGHARHRRCTGRRRQPQGRRVCRDGEGHRARSWMSLNSAHSFWRHARLSDLPAGLCPVRDSALPAATLDHSAHAGNRSADLQSQQRGHGAFVVRSLSGMTPTPRPATGSRPGF